MPTYTSDGRTISRDGKEIAFLHKCGDDKKGYALSPTEADSLTKEIVRKLNTPDNAGVGPIRLELATAQSCCEGLSHALRHTAPHLRPNLAATLFLVRNTVVEFLTGLEFAEICAGFKGAALFSSTGDEDRPLDRDFGVEDFSEESNQRIQDVVYDFCCLSAEDLKQSRLPADDIGQDLWFSANGHGTGFWDRGLREIGKRLTASAKTMGSFDVVVGDDRKLHLEG